jgi:uncharacterized coiled-coil protein SlyX
MAQPPPFKRPPRLQSQTERDMAGLAAKRERESAPDFVEPEITGNYEGDELANVRARRPTPMRLSRLETKHDELRDVVTEMRVEVSGMSGKLDVLPSLVSAVRDSVKSSQQREHVADLDELDEKKNKRERITKVLGWLFGGGILLQILNKLGVL